jgi:hypothetical protein
LAARSSLVYFVPAFTQASSQVSGQTHISRFRPQPSELKPGLYTKSNKGPSTALEPQAILTSGCVAWLQDLDSGPHSADGHNFAQYVELLEQKMFKCIFQLESLTDDTLVTICNTMAPGTASLILQYAHKDCGKICKKETQ